MGFGSGVIKSLPGTGGGSGIGGSGAAPYKKPAVATAARSTSSSQTAPVVLFVDKYDLADEGKSLPTARDATLDMGYVDVVENITLMIEFVHEQ